MRDIESSLRKSLSARAETYSPTDVDAAERRFLERRNRRRMVRAGGGAVLAAAAVVAVFALARPEVVTTPDPQLEPAGLRIAERFDVPEEPLAVAGGPGGIWVASRQAGAITSIDPSTGATTELDLRGASQVAADGDITWAAGTDRIVRFDDATGQTAGEYPGDLIDVPVAPAVDMAVGGRARGGAWAVGPTGCVADLEDLQNRVCVEPDDFHATDVATGPGETWLLDGDTGDLHQLHAEPGVNEGRAVVNLEARIPTAPPGRYADFLITTAGNDAIWVSGGEGQLMRLDLVTGEETVTRLDGDYADLAADDRSVWALVGHEGSDRGDLVAIDVETGTPVGEALVLSGKPSDIVATADGVWITLRTADQVLQIIAPGS